MIGDALGVIASRHRHHPGAPLGGVEREQLVQGAALLERTGRLHRLELQIHLTPGKLGQDRRPDRRGARDRTLERRCGMADIGDRHRQGGHFCGSRTSVAAAAARPGTSHSNCRHRNNRSE